MRSRRRTTKPSARPDSGSTCFGPEETRSLCRALSEFEDDIHVVFSGEGAVGLGRAVAGLQPSTRITALLNDAGERRTAEELETLPNFHLVLATSLSAVEGPVDIVVVGAERYEGKQRLIVRLTESAQRLKPGGILFLLTHTHAGAKSHIRILTNLFGNVDVLYRGGGGKRILRSIRDQSISPSGTSDLRRIDTRILGEHLIFMTRQGVFSKDRIDEGSRLLLEWLPPLGEVTVLDLGCGYGVLGITLAKRYPTARVTMIDRHLDAVELARENVELNEVAAGVEVLLSDGLSGVPERTFDIVVTHFPLHIPRNDLLKILTEARDTLIGDGQLFGVALAKYAVGPLVQSIFRHTTVVSSGPHSDPSQYSLIKARR